MILDLDLLKRFERDHSQDAFTDLVKRHVNLVYSAALRQVRSPHLAEEITQSVFADLARNAGKLKADTVLTAWLYQVARRTAIDVVRKESRRQAREQIALEMNHMNATAGDWTQIEPLLDDAMDALDETDRAAILLRYFENKNLREVGESLKISDDAAQKRVSRALERLREFFTRRNVTIGASGLAVLISANAVQSAPIGLIATLSAAAVLTGTTVSTSTVIAAAKTIAMTTLQKTLITAVLVATIGAGAFEAHQASQARVQNLILQQQQAPLAEQVRQLQQDLNDTSNQLASLIVENEQLQGNPDRLELLKLRGEVAVLQNAANDPMQKAVIKVADKVKLLKQLLEERPDKKIPELRFLTDKVCADVSWNADLDTDDGIRLALSNLRGEAENIFLNEMMKGAINKYLRANNDILPANLFELKSYFDVPVTDEMLQRYTLLQTGKPNKSADLVKLTTYVDQDYDSNHVITINGASGGGFNRVHDAIYDAVVEFTMSNNGQPPSDPSQIAAYLKRPVDSTTMQKYFGQITADVAANPPSTEQLTITPALTAYKAANNGQYPTNPSDLLPYLTTPEQQAALQKLEKEYPDSK